MELPEDRAISHLAKLSEPSLRVLRAVTKAHVDGSLAANVIDVRRRLATLDDHAFLVHLAVLLCYGLVESKVWPQGWKCWASRHGWATVLEADGKWEA